MTYDIPASHYEYQILDTMAVKMKAAEYMGQLYGWCSTTKAGILVDWILQKKPMKIVEIGVYGGKSLVPMAYALKINGCGKIYGIDPWDVRESLAWVQDPSNRYFWGSVNHGAIYQHLVDKIYEFHLENQIELICDTSARAEPIMDIDLLHIDGNHSEVTSLIDVQKWLPCVKSGGIIIFDDMTWYENGTFTTAKAIEWLDQRCKKVAEFQDDAVWGIWVKP